MSKNKAVVTKMDQKEILKSIQATLETNLLFLKSGLTDKKWLRNIKKASKLMLEDYKHPTALVDIVKEDAEKKEKVDSAEKKSPAKKKLVKKAVNKDPKK